MEKKSLRRPKHSIIEVVETEEEEYTIMPISVAERSKARVCCRSSVGIAVSNPAWGMNVSLL